MIAHVTRASANHFAPRRFAGLSAYVFLDPGAAPALSSLFSLLPGPVVTPSGTRDNFAKSGTVPEIPGQLEPIYVMDIPNQLNVPVKIDGMQQHEETHCIMPEWLACKSGSARAPLARSRPARIISAKLQNCAYRARIDKHKLMHWSYRKREKELELRLELWHDGISFCMCTSNMEEWLIAY